MKSLIRPDSLIGQYLLLKEGGAVSDFPNLMANVQHKLLIDAFRGWPSPVEKYTLKGDLSDFKTHDRDTLSEAEDLLEITSEAPYQTTAFGDKKYQIVLKTFGRTFQLLRKTIINDDLNAFRTIPEKLGRSAKRKLAKTVVEILNTNANAYDGNPLFGTRNSIANHSSTALTADTTGITAMQTGIAAIKRSKDPTTGEIFGAVPKYLLVSPTLESVGRWLLSNTEVRGGSSSALTRNQLLDHNLELLVEPMLENVFTERWYLLAEPTQVPTIEVGYYDGMTEPELFMKESDAVRVAGGGRDMFGYEYDDLNYKVRHDWGVACALYQGAFKGGA